MSAVAIIGTQWGDEGKGKITDLLALRADWVVRFQGGNNAGHTVVAEGRTLKLHLLPSGISHVGKTCVLGNGVVIDPLVLVEEIDRLLQQDLTLARLSISDRAHVIMPYHKELDRLEEEARGDLRIGTTERGVGPAYVDKVGRSGIRFAEFVRPEAFRARLEAVLPLKNRLLEMYGAEPMSVDEILEAYAPAAERLRPLVADTGELLTQALAAGQRVLFEGAQGTLLDVEHGTYPFVTSSSPSAGSVALGAGVGPHALTTVLGVAKAYTTRVGTGPFPTEDLGADGDTIRERGNEYGTTTGRPRRCGWFDAVVVRYAARVGGIDQLAVTCLDVLGAFDELKICVAYELDGERIDNFPASILDLDRCRPVYETVEGWAPHDISGARRLSDLPRQALAYLDRISELTGVPIALVSVGPSREQTIEVEGASLWGRAAVESSPVQRRGTCGGWHKELGRASAPAERSGC